ncbi:hypothetical protein AMS68_006053 [Peltaster fructicola]|uniref:AMP-activated protein kinase glycogen-binding domain-containing protein n=1 Tax=Peltaster fructicola TaxID=286661 RepID=A0A6H0Y0S9_9PEZI|nr:hypothetical protein AMS68_006053 [Peltaster fructicola]
MSFNFTWAHPAKEVFVTGSFDGWTKSVQLEKHGEIFQKEVPLPHVVDKIYYKFVADGEWIYDHTAKTEEDHEGNLNNVLYPADITHNSANISSVAPGATTTKMAAEQPKTTTTPGAFPITPAADDNKTFSVNPIPASSGPGNPISLPAGEPVPEFNKSAITSGVHDDPELKALDQKVSVAPIPATGGASNPIHLAPGEKVPDASTITANTLQSNVKLDQASYERSDTGAPVLPPPLSPGSEREAAGAPIFGLGTGTLIPESGLPMGVAPASADENVGPTINSVAPTSTTAKLAAAVPIEPRGVPEVVEESQQTAHVSPEASANPEAVADKSALEQELKSKVPEEPATSTSGTFGKSEAGVVGAAAGGLAAAGVAVSAAISSVAPNSTTTGLAGQVPKEERGVPLIVKESQQEAHVSPEASANAEAVREKSQLEQELQSAVTKAPATSESGMFGKSERGITGAIAGGVAAAGAAAAGTAYALRDKTTQATGTDPVSVLPTSVQQKIDGQPAVTSATITNVAEDTGVPRQFALGESPHVPGPSTTSAVPKEVVTSQKEAHVSPEASANTEAVQEKSEVERELLSKVKPDQSQGAPAPSTGAALSATAPSTTTASGTALSAAPSTGAPQLSPIAAAAPIDLDAGAKENKPVSGDVSPMSKPSEPTVTTGVATARIPKDSTPQKRNSFMERFSGTPESSKSATDDADGKKKRKSFGKLKDKFNKP